MLSDFATDTLDVINKAFQNSERVIQASAWMSTANQVAQYEVQTHITCIVDMAHDIIIWPDDDHHHVINAIVSQQNSIMALITPWRSSSGHIIMLWAMSTMQVI